MSQTITTEDEQFFARLTDVITSSQPGTKFQNASAADILADLGTPSISIAILENGNITSYNISIPTLKHNTETLFQACSISKPCAGLAIAKLIENDLFSLEDKAVSLLPDDIVRNMTSDSKTENLVRSITMKQLMSHTSGLSIHGFPGYPVEYHSYESLPDAAGIIRGREPTNTAQIKVIAPPGLEFMYSGGGMTVLQLIAETATGKSFDQLMRELIFEPLGMTRTCYRLPAEEKNVAEAWFTGYTRCETRYHLQPELAAAGVWTTPQDLLKLVRALQGSLKEDNTNDNANRFLSTEFARKMVTRVKFSMGLTWFCDEFAFGHGGSNNPGYRCMLYGYADMPWNKQKKKQQTGSDIAGPDEVPIPQDSGLAVMTNAASGQGVMWSVLHAITYLKGWREPPRHYTAVEQGAPFGVDGEIEGGKNSDWKDWIGEWVSEDGDIVWKVTADEQARPTAGIDLQSSEMMMRLRTAAVSPLTYKGGKSTIDLVVDGTQVMLRLTWAWDKDKGAEQRTIEQWHFQLQSRTVLYRR